MKYGFRTYFNAGFLGIISMLFGVNSAWGLIEPYIASYLIIHDPTKTTSSVHLLNLMITIAGLPASYSFVWVINFCGYKQGIGLSCIIAFTGLLLSYFTTNFYLMIIGWFLFGMGKHWFKLVGSFMMMLLMPDSIGLANSLSNVGTSFAPIYWSYMALALLNPNNSPADITRQEGETTRNYWSEGSGVASNLPYLFIVNS